jgi:hypothetical protein
MTVGRGGEEDPRRTFVLGWAMRETDVAGGGHCADSSASGGHHASGYGCVVMWDGPGLCLSLPRVSV